MKLNQRITSSILLMKLKKMLMELAESVILGSGSIIDATNQIFLKKIK